MWRAYLVRTSKRRPPASPSLVVTRLVCSLAGVEQEVFVSPDTLAFNAYGKPRAVERFTCNFGLNEAYRNDIFRGDLRIAGTDRDGNTRIIELASHHFFMATLFLPQLSSKPGAPHPVIAAFLEAAFRSPATPPRQVPANKT